MSLQRPGGVLGSTGAGSDLYTKPTDDATITGDWNFTGNLTINGDPLSDGLKSVTEGNTGVLAGSATGIVTITHGLGTDNVSIQVMVSSTNDAWGWMSKRVSGHVITHSRDAAFFTGTEPGAPSSGDIVVSFQNASGSNDTINYVIVVRSLD